MYKSYPTRSGKVQYLHILNTNKPKLLFLPGFGMLPTDYKRLFSFLKTDFEIISPRIMAPGDITPAAISMNDFLLATKALIVHLQLRQFIVMGDSTGAAIALKLASERKSVKAVIATAPVLPSGHDFLEFLERLAKIGKNEQRKRVLNPIRIVRGAKLRYHAYKYIKETIRLIHDIGRFSFEEVNVNQPVLLIHGRKDEFFILTPKIRKQLKTCCKKITIKVLRDENHIFTIRRPEVIKKILLEFLHTLK